MRINGMNSTNQLPAAPANNQLTDAYSKNLQNQIENAKKRLQELSTNTEMPPEEKMKKRQEISKEINDLQNQLRQHEIELRKQAQQQKEAAKDQNAQGDRQAKEEKGNAGLSGEHMQALVMADSSMKQAQVHGKVKTEMEGRAGVLSAEIKQDRGKGLDTSAKESALAELEQKAADEAGAQIGILAEAGRKLQEASKSQQTGNSEPSERKDEDVTAKAAGRAEQEQSTDEKKAASRAEQEHPAAAGQEQSAEEKNAAGRAEQEHPAAAGQEQSAGEKKAAGGAGHPAAAGQEQRAEGKHPSGAGQEPIPGGKHPSVAGQEPILGGKHPSVAAQARNETIQKVRTQREEDAKGREESTGGAGKSTYLYQPIDIRL